MSSYKARQDRKKLLRLLKLRRKVGRSHKRSYDIELSKLIAENNTIRREAAADVMNVKMSRTVRWDRPVVSTKSNDTLLKVTDGRLRMICNTVRLSQLSLTRNRGEAWKAYVLDKVSRDLADMLVSDGLLTIEWPSDNAMGKAFYGERKGVDMGNISVRWGLMVAPVPMESECHS